jgi:preprotein translocase subunit YajC
VANDASRHEIGILPTDSTSYPWPLTPGPWPLPPNPCPLAPNPSPLVPPRRPFSSFSPCGSGGKCLIYRATLKYSRFFQGTGAANTKGMHMSQWILTFCLFAEEAGGEGQQPPGGNLFSMLLPLVAIGFLFYFLLIRPQRKEQSKRQTMLSAVKKNDRVVTIGGIYGVVTNVQREEDEVTIRIDEATNTKIRVTMGAIARILGEESAEDTNSSK